MARTGARLLALGLVLALAGCGGSSADKAGGTHTRRAATVLTLANPLGLLDVGLFAGKVADLSHGTMRIKVKNGWRLGQTAYENGVIRDVRAGKADLGVAGSRAWDSVGVDSLRAFAAPLLIQSYAAQERVLESPIVAPMLRGLRPLGLVGIGVLPGPLRRPLGVRPLLEPSDYAGLAFGVQQSRVADATLRALGAKPVWFGVAAPIAGFGGIEQQVSAIAGNQYYRVAKYLTANVALWPRPLVVFANRRSFARLTPTQRSVLRRAAAADVHPQTIFLLSGEHTDASNLCRARRVRWESASSADIAALRRAVQPVYDQLDRDPQTRRFIGQIAAVAKTVRPEAPPACAAQGAGAGQARARTPLDGVYRMVTKIGDAPDPQPVPENYGNWIFVFDRGRFADTQVYRDACTWGYGMYTVTGNQMAWRFIDGGGIAPTHSENKPGESFRFGWSIYRDTVTVTPVKGAVSPGNFRLKPWHRISTTPSSRYFSKRCPPPAQALPH